MIGNQKSCIFVNFFIGNKELLNSKKKVDLQQMNEVGYYQNQSFIKTQNMEDFKIIKYSQMPSPYQNQSISQIMITCYQLQKQNESKDIQFDYVLYSSSPQQLLYFFIFPMKLEQIRMNKMRVPSSYQYNPYNQQQVKLKSIDQSPYSGTLNSNRQQNSTSPFRRLDGNQNRNEFLPRESIQRVTPVRDRRQNQHENSPIMVASVFSTQKSSPRIPKINKQQTKLHDIFSLYNINLQNYHNQQLQQSTITMNKYRQRINIQSSLQNGSSQSSLIQSYDTFNPQSLNPNQTEQKNTLEQITESGAESTNPTQACMPITGSDNEKIENHSTILPSAIRKLNLNTRSISNKKGRNVESSSLGRQKLVCLPYTQIIPQTQPSSTKFQNKIQQNILSNKSQKYKRVIRYQTEVNHTDNCLDKSLQNMSCIETCHKTPDNTPNGGDSIESSDLNQEQFQGSANSQLIKINSSATEIIQSNIHLVPIKSLHGSSNKMSNPIKRQLQIPNCHLSYNTLQNIQMNNSMQETHQQIRGINRQKNLSMNIVNNNNSLIKIECPEIQNYNEAICFNSQNNLLLPSHRSDRDESSPFSSNGIISTTKASYKAPLTQIPTINPIFKKQNATQLLNDKPKSALNFNKAKTLNQSDIIKRNQISMDNFQLHETLGKGSYASVKLATDKRTNEKVAIKIYEKFKLSDPNKFKNVRREINILSKMTHDNIIRLYQVIDTVISLNLIMEYIGNNSLYNYLRAKRKNQLQMNQIRKIFTQIISGVQYMHKKNVCHRDIKLENILIDEDLNLKIIDFGFALVSPIERKIDSFCGTPSYMAPEIIMKKEYIGQYVDIWTCGIVLYILICGRFPFKGQDEKELYRKIQKNQYEFPSFVEKGAKQLIQRLLAFNPEDRPSCSTILKDKWLTSLDDSITIQPDSIEQVSLTTNENNLRQDVEKGKEQQDES